MSTTQKHNAPGHKYCQRGSIRKLEYNKRTVFIDKLQVKGTRFVSYLFPGISLCRSMDFDEAQFKCWCGPYSSKPQTRHGLPITCGLQSKCVSPSLRRNTGTPSTCQLRPVKHKQRHTPPPMR